MDNLEFDNLEKVNGGARYNHFDETKDNPSAEVDFWLTALEITPAELYKKLLRHMKPFDARIFFEIDGAKVISENNKDPKYRYYRALYTELLMNPKYKF